MIVSETVEWITVTDGEFSADLDPTHPLTVIGQSTGLDWVGVAKEMLDSLMDEGMSEEDALAQMNEGHTWGFFRRANEQERASHA